MKFRIVEKHDGVNYYYIIQQLWVLFWKQPDNYDLRRIFLSCKNADDALSGYELVMNTNNVIIEREINVL